MAEFFATRTVAEAQDEFRPARRTAVEEIAGAAALGRVPAAPVTSPASLPGFARATVDGYAVRAADTWGASEGLPSYLDVVGGVTMGAAAEVAVRAGGAVAIPTGGALPDGADAVVMVEHTAATLPGTIEVVRPVAPGDGLVRADEDVAAGTVLAPAGRPLRAQDLGLLAAAGVMAVRVHARPLVTILSTGDEVVPPGTERLRPGQVRDATASALAALVAQAGGTARQGGIVADDPGALEGVLREALTASDLVVVSAGSSVGARDQTAAAVAALGTVWCHGLALKPGKPTLLAACPGGSGAAPVPVVGLPGNPLSALVVFRLIAIPLVWRLAGCEEPPPEPTVLATLARDLPSAAGRLDVVQVTLAGDVATPLFGPSAMLSLLTAADGWVVVPEDANGLDAGAPVTVTRYR